MRMVESVTFSDFMAKEYKQPLPIIKKKVAKENDFDSIFQEEIKKVNENGNQFKTEGRKV